VPVHVLIADVPGVEANQLTATSAIVSEVCLIARQAGGVLISQHISLAAELGVAMPAGEMASVVVPIESPRVGATEYKLITSAASWLDLLSIVSLAV